MYKRDLTLALHAKDETSYTASTCSPVREFSAYTCTEILQWNLDPWSYGPAGERANKWTKSILLPSSLLSLRVLNTEEGSFCNADIWHLLQLSNSKCLFRNFFLRASTSTLDRSPQVPLVTAAQHSLPTYFGKSDFGKKLFPKLFWKKSCVSLLDLWAFLFLGRGVAWAQSFVQTPVHLLKHDLLMHFYVNYFCVMFAEAFRLQGVIVLLLICLASAGHSNRTYLWWYL